MASIKEWVRDFKRLKKWDKFSNIATLISLLIALIIGMPSTNYVLRNLNKPKIDIQVSDSEGSMMVTIKSNKVVDTLSMGIPIKGKVRDLINMNQVADAQGEPYKNGPDIENSMNKYDFIIKNIEPNISLFYEIKYEPMIGIPPFNGPIKIPEDDVYKISYTWGYGGAHSEWRDFSGNVVEESPIKSYGASIETPYNEYSQGINLMKAGKLDEAVAYYNQVIGQNASPITYELRALCFVRIKKYDLAVRDYTKAIEGSTEPNIVYYHNRGKALSNLGKYSEAISDYDKALTCPLRDNSLCKIYFDRAIAYEALARYDEAISDYSESIKGCPSFASPYLNLANDYARKGDKNNALKNYREFIFLDKDDSKT